RHRQDYCCRPPSKEIDPGTEDFYKDFAVSIRSLEAAQADAACRTPETCITKLEPMWGYRCARERNIKVNGSLEPDPPTWILQYAFCTQHAWVGRSVRRRDP
ncbi:MAG TPA: hypothetical protein VHZ74_04210, partial [Bryobacteraceae bacterium]|nr:hypothetical protein [Bryobacteraceae bacterium]